MLAEIRLAVAHHGYRGRFASAFALSFGPLGRISRRRASTASPSSPNKGRTS